MELTCSNTCAWRGVSEWCPVCRRLQLTETETKIYHHPKHPLWHNSYTERMNSSTAPPSPDADCLNPKFRLLRQWEMLLWHCRVVGSVVLFQELPDKPWYVNVFHVFFSYAHMLIYIMSHIFLHCNGSAGSQTIISFFCVSAEFTFYFLR